MYVQAAGTGGGGSTPTTGNVAWGPDFGEKSGNDGYTFNAGATASFPALAVRNDKTVGATITLPALTAVYTPQTVGAHLSGSVLGAPFWQSEAHAASTGITAGATGLTVTKPSGTVNGDLLLAFVAVSDAIANAAPIVTVPAGWTAVTNGAKSLAGAAFNYNVKAFYRIASGEPASYNLQWSNSASYATAEIHRVIGTDTVNPVNVAANNAAVLGVGNPADPPAPAVTTTVVNCMIVGFLYHDHLALTQVHNPPASHDERTDYQANIAGATFQGATSATRVFAASGVQVAVTFDCGETVNTDWVTLRVAVAPGVLVIAA